jgi:hypothetical protein
MGEVMRDSGRDVDPTAAVEATLRAAAAEPGVDPTTAEPAGTR